jgi:DNA-binding beta-propeller fold protein YncE
VTTDAAGFVNVSDADGHIQKFTSSGAQVLKWGSTGTGPGQFDFPGRPAIDPSGFVIVPDQNNHWIRVFRADGTYAFEWGSFGTGYR